MAWDFLLCKIYFCFFTNTHIQKKMVNKLYYFHFSLEYIDAVVAKKLQYMHVIK